MEFWQKARTCLPDRSEVSELVTSPWEIIRLFLDW